MERVIFYQPDNLEAPYFEGVFYTKMYNTKPSFKDKRRYTNKKENWAIFENTHEAIIDKETWEIANSLLNTVRRPSREGTVNPLTGKLFCGDCGEKLYNSRGTNHKGTGHYKEDVRYDNYICLWILNGQSKMV